MKMKSEKQRRMNNIRGDVVMIGLLFLAQQKPEFILIPLIVIIVFTLIDVDKYSKASDVILDGISNDGTPNQ